MKRLEKGREAQNLRHLLGVGHLAPEKMRVRSNISKRDS